MVAETYKHTEGEMLIDIKSGITSRSQVCSVFFPFVILVDLLVQISCVQSTKK